MKTLLLTALLCLIPWTVQAQNERPAPPDTLDIVALIDSIFAARQVACYRVDTVFRYLRYYHYAEATSIARVDTSLRIDTVIVPCIQEEP